MINTLINQFHKIFTKEKQGAIKSALLDMDLFEDY